MNRNHTRQGPLLLSSREAASRLGIGTSTLNRWADEGRIACRRTAGGHRRFTPSAIDALARKQWGEPDPTLQASWTDRLLAVPDARALRAELLLSRSEHGAWNEVADLLAPSVVELGARWANGELSIVEEHLASARLTRALAGIVESIPVSPEAPIVLLATPESEEHTLGLAFAELCAREAGLRTHWIGARTPAEDLAGRIEEEEPLACVTISASAFSGDAAHLAQVVEILATACQRKGAELVVGGSGAWPEPMAYGTLLRSYASYGRLLKTLGPGARGPRLVASIGD